MKVLQINSVCGIGSTGRIAMDIHNILIEQGHGSYIAFGRDLPMNCDSTIKIGTKYDNYGHVALTRIFDKHGFGSKKATKKFIKEVERINPDIIHLHNIHGYYINIEMLFTYLKKANKPVIWTLHDCWAFTGHCSHFDYIGCDKWKYKCYDCPQKGEYPKSYIKDNSENNYLNKKNNFKGFDNLTIITPSKWLSELVEKSFLKEYDIKIIHNGIDLEVFKPQKSDFRQKYKLKDKYIILGVASIWRKRKGLNCFIELSGDLNPEEVIVLIGVTEKQKKQLPKNIVGLNVTNSIEELAEIYSAADVFVNPTLEEVMGLTNVEALACGTPVITFNTGGSVECVDESTGIIVERENSNQLLKAIRSLKDNGKKMYIERCKQRAIKMYDKRDRAADYVEVYKQIIDCQMIDYQMISQGEDNKC